MPYISIDKSKNRYFWISGTQAPTQPLQYSGYATSKEEAVQAATAALGTEYSQVTQLASLEASCVTWHFAMQVVQFPKLSSNFG